MNYKISIQDARNSRRVLPGIVTKEQARSQIQQLNPLLNPKLIPISFFFPSPKSRRIQK